MVDPYRMVFINSIAVILLTLGVCIYRYIYPKKKIHPLPLLILVSLLPLISLLRKGTYESGLLSENAGVAFSFYQTLQEGIINPMWSERACSGFGCPLFIFQYKLPFFITSLFHFIGFSILSSLKLLIALSYVTSAITMYYWAKSETNKSAGFVASLFYLFAPYHLSTMHFRVSIGEIVSYAFPPLILLCIKRIIEKGNAYWIVTGSVAMTLLIMSHQATTMLFMPFFIAYIFITYKRQNKRRLQNLITAFLTLCAGILLSAFYWLPLLLNGKYIQIAKVTDVIFQPFWYYLYSPFHYRFGLLFQGQHGELYTNVGYIFYLTLVISLVLLFKNRFTKNDKLLYLMLLGFFIIYFLLMQSITRPLWQAVPFLLNLQFSWRFLIQISLFVSLIAGLVVKNLNSKAFTVIISFLVVLITILNWGNRKTLPHITDVAFEKSSLFLESPCNAELTTPVWVNTCSSWIGRSPVKPIDSLTGVVDYRQLYRSSIHHSYLVYVSENAVIKENTYFFPGWKVFANSKEIPIDFKNKQYPGVITFQLSKGLYKVDVEYTKTLERKIGELTSMLIASTLLLAVLDSRVRKQRNIKNIRKKK